MKTKRTETLATGPRNCLRSKTIRGVCDRCGTTPEILHLPLRLHGFFCVTCCPTCNAIISPTRSAKATGSKPPAEGGGAVLAVSGPRGGAFNRRPFGKRYSRYLEG
jgi:fucose permease